ncbi:hypothetical protein AC739_12440 [Planococcus glaciei]|uniref:flagellar hook-associated protein FlgK n=1 Tax=Planococcus glaciei TaxID=459472 RepID=UPI00069DFDE4|nr:flagellar hook-associated protein FlgK [Planococcus glaciei]KOF09895.1 hypothetical protein AC739_12440 [Planococcus glaciei]
MASTFHGLELGKRGLSVAQTNITTTGHNIANANTEGYSRQKVNSSATPSLDVWTTNQTGQLGTGAQIDSINRVRDRFLDAQHRDQSSTLGEWTVRQETLEQLEVAINEPSKTGLNAVMDELNAAWQGVRNNPEDASAQAVLKERAGALVETAQSMNKAMASITADLTSQQEIVLEEAENLMKQIEGLNVSIKKSSGQSNDLQDKRDVLIGKLSEIIPVKVKDLKDGTAQVTLPEALEIGADGSISLKSGATVPGGKLAGIQKSLEAAAQYQTDLNRTVEGFADANGGLFAANAIPNADYITNLTVGTTVDPSAVNQAELEAAQGGFRSLVSKMGAKSQTAMNMVANNEAALLATENRRQSVTGVSIDEEMANLIMFQHAYSAAARFVTTTDEMLDTIINRMAN